MIIYKNNAQSVILQALLDSLLDVVGVTLLNLFIKPIKSTAIQRQSISKFPLILTHIAQNLKFY